jgi:hypothetical protein
MPEALLGSADVAPGLRCGPVGQPAGSVLFDVGMACLQGLTVYQIISL